VIYKIYRDISKNSISFSTIRYIDIENDISMYTAFGIWVRLSVCSWAATPGDYSST